MTTDRFQMVVLGQTAECPRELLGPIGTLLLPDVVPAVGTVQGKAFLMPVPDLRTFDPRQALPTLTRNAPSPNLVSVLAAQAEPCTSARQEGRLVVCPPGERVTIELVRIQDARSNKPALLLLLQDHVLHFAHRGRVVSLDVSAHAGLPLVVAAHWGPSNVSLELQGGAIDPAERSIAISFDGPAPEFQLLRGVAEGASIPTAAPDAHANWCLGLVALIRRGTAREQIKDFTRLVFEEAVPLFQGIAASTSSFVEGTPLMFASYVTPIEVDDERFDRWRAAFGWDSETAAHCDVVFLRHPLSNSTRHSALSAAAYAYAGHLDRLAVNNAEPEFVPPFFVDRRDVHEWFWYHACARHYLVDDLAVELKRELVARVDARRSKLAMTTLRSEPLADLFDAADREWLETQLGREDKKQRKQDLNTWVRKFSAGENIRSTTIAAFRALRSDVSVMQSPAYGEVMDLWISASKLSADVAAIRRTDASEEMCNALTKRLRALDVEARKCEFEIEAFAALLRCGHAGRFVPTSDDQRTPDIELGITAPVYVECAELAPDSNQVEAAKTATTQLLHYLHAQAPKRQRSLLLEIVYPDGASSRVTDAIQRWLKPHVEADGMVPVQGTVAGCEVALSSLGAWERAWRLESADAVAPTASWVHFTGYGDQTWSPRGFVCNASAVAVTIDTSRRLLTSLESRLRDKAKSRSRKGQFPDGCSGVCAISLGDIDPIRAKEVIDGAIALVPSFHDLSALVLFWSERQAVKYVPIGRRWYAKTIHNPRAKIGLPTFALPDGLLMAVPNGSARLPSARRWPKAVTR
jgi:hypothetical protein